MIEGSTNDIYNPVQTILNNRGITDCDTYLNLTEKNLYSPYLLDNIEAAADIFTSHIEKKNKIYIVVDSDTDGYTSAACVFNYIKDQYGTDYPVNALIHTAKQHGLSPDIIVPEDCKLLIIPDAGSNDAEQCKDLSIKGIDIIILDHHLSDVSNQYATIVNNQMCNYPNKNLSGVGIVYKFLQVVDEVAWGNGAEKLIDLVALGNIADCMDMREYETKYLCMRGLSFVENSLLNAIIEKNGFYIEATPTITDIQFSVVPLINALIRMGSQKQKEMMFRAFTNSKEIFKYKKRGETEPIDETIAQRVAREASNLKVKQNKEKEAALEKIYEYVKHFHLDENKIIFCNVTDYLNPALTGVTAMKVAEYYNRPCVLIRKVKDKDGVFGGSGRNVDNSFVPNFKELLDSTEEFDFVQGHENAFGVEIQAENINKAIAACNAQLAKQKIEKLYLVDFDLDYQDVGVGAIKDLYSIHNIYGQCVKEPLLVVHKIRVSRDTAKVMGKMSNTWKYTDEETGIEIIKMGCKSDDPILSWLNSWDDTENDKLIDVVCKVKMNQYKGVVTPQITVVDEEIVG